MFTPPARKKLKEICESCDEIGQENVNVDEILISKGQAKILKSISSLMGDKKLSKNTLSEIIENNPEIIYLIHDNWGSKEYFIKLSLNHITPNPISLIMNFLNLKNKIKETPTQEKMEHLSDIPLITYEKTFGTWEGYLDLLGFDPWYKDNKTIKKISKPKSHQLPKILYEDSVSCFKGDESQSEITEKINQIKKNIQKYCEKKDLENNYSEYSFVEMFKILEKYLEILPKKPRNDDIKNFL